MLLHFKLFCFIFVMLVGQINLIEKVSYGGNVDAFFDPSLDDLQDNFYDIPFIPPAENNPDVIENFQTEIISEHDIFQFGRDKLVQDQIQSNTNKSKTKRNDDGCFEQSLNDSSSSSTLLESVVEKFNQIGKEKNSLHLKMQNIEDDEAILENQKPSFRYTRNRRVKRNSDSDTLIRKKRRYINSIYFSHKYRHKRPSISNFNYDEADPQIEKRTCNNKRPKMPHKHRNLNAPLLASKHEEFKDELIQDEGCNVKTNVAQDESGCNTTTKHKEHPTEETTTKKHKQLQAASKHQTTVKAKQQSKEKCDKNNLTTTEHAKKAGTTKHQIVVDTSSKKSSIPPTKPSIKSVLCHKHPKFSPSATTSSTNEFEEYEDYKAGDYKDFMDQTQNDDRVKREKSTCKDDENSGKGEKNAIDEFLREETTLPPHSGPSMPASGRKQHREDAIDQFLKEETTRATKTMAPQNYLKRNVHQFALSSEDENYDEGSDPPAMKSKTKVEDSEKLNNIDRFLNGEVPKTKILQFASSTANGIPLRKHKQFMKIEKTQHKKTQSRNDFQSKRTAFLMTPIFNNERVYQKKMKMQLKGSSFYENPTYITEDPDIYKIIQLMSTTEKYSRSSTHEKRLKPNIYIVKSKNEDDYENNEEEVENSQAKPHVKLKQRIYMVKPKLKQNFEDSKKFKVNLEEGKHFDQVPNYESNKNRMEPSEAELINYLKKMIQSQKFHQLNNENSVSTKEELSKFAETTDHPPNSKIYVAHTKNQGRQHHRIYFEPEKNLKSKQKIKSNSKTETITQKIARNLHEETTKNKYEKFLERLKNKDLFRSEEVTTKKVKHETDDIDEIETEAPEIKENPEITELYSEIPVNKKRIQLSLNCDGTDYLNKDHCICSVKTMLRDLMDDLKDINTSLNYQYDCSKYIGIEPGVVIANDSRRMLTVRDRRQLFYSNFLSRRKGSRIGRDVDTLLNENLNVDDLDNFIYATVGSKVVLHCGNNSNDYSEDDKIVWTVQNGAPETAGFKEDNGRELIIQRASAQDTNNYTCAISHRLEDGNYGPSQKFLHKLSIVEIPIYSLMITVMLNESAKCEQDDLETLHNYYPIMLNKFLCNGAEQICSISVDKPHCTKSHSENGVSMHATLKTLPLYTILPELRKKQQICGINCQSRIYSIIVKTLQNNFASVANLPVFFRDNKEHKKFLPIQYEVGDKANMFSNSILTICPQGFGIFQQNEKLCLACEPQTYNPGNKKNCLNCPSGSYQPLHGAGSCLPCTSPLDDTRCLFGSKAELAPKLYFIIPIILVLVVIILIICCIYSSTRKSKINEANYLSGKNIESPENIQTKVIEQVFTGEPSEKSYSTVTQRQKRESEKKRKKSKPPPPPVDFN